MTGDERVMLAYRVFRGGFGKAAFDIPATWDDLLPYVRDAMRTAYLQGKLDGSTHYASPSDGEDASMKEVLRMTLEALEHWFKKAHPEWDGSAEPQSAIGEARAKLTSQQRAEPKCSTP